MKRCKYVVRYSSLGEDHVARFSDYFAALAFAREHGRSSEMADATGLLAQFSGGKLTPEFAHLEGDPPAPVDDGSCDPLYGQRMDSADMGEN